MGAYSYLNGKKIKFWKVNILTLEDFIKLFPSLANKELKIKESVSGTVIFSGDKEGLYIKANDGIIEVVELQAENAKRMNIYDFLRGNKVDIGNIFEK